jgi:hypothetical protein
MSYSRFINGLMKAGITLDRKVLADIAVHDAAGFAALAEKAKERARGVSRSQRSPRNLRLSSKASRMGRGASPSHVCFRSLNPLVAALFGPKCVLTSRVGRSSPVASLRGQGSSPVPHDRGPAIIWIRIA